MNPTPSKSIAGPNPVLVEPAIITFQRSLPNVAVRSTYSAAQGVMGERPSPATCLFGQQPKSLLRRLEIQVMRKIYR